MGGPAVIRPFRRLDHLVGYRGSVLLFLGLWSGGNAARLFWPDPEVIGTATYIYLATIAPLWILAIPWALAALACLIGAFLDRDAYAFALLAGLMIAWAVVYLVGGVVGAIPQAYWATIVQVVLAGLVLRISGWPEPIRGR